MAKPAAFKLVKRPETIRHGKTLRTGPIKKELDRIEVASRDEISALQLERLQWSLAHAYENVPRHREKFERQGVHPSDVKTLEDLARFPFMAKDDLRETFPFAPKPEPIGS